MKTQHYFNTAAENQSDVIQYTEKAKTQAEIIIDLYPGLLNKEGSPSQVHRFLALMAYFWPITSVRRAISVLTREGKLIKTDRVVRGPYGRNERIYKLKY
jgi:hypothetical protein